MNDRGMKLLRRLWFWLRGWHMCRVCERRIDPKVCWCGDAMSPHHDYGGHHAVPMGCICGFVSQNGSGT